MARRPSDRIFGVETEFGCLVSNPDLGPPEAVVELIKDHLFYEARVGAIDLHARDEVFEPAKSGGFLVNGGRLYIDAVGSHLEYATAECRLLRDLVANDRAGERLIVRAIDELGLRDEVDVYNNSIDHFGGHTFGCHENYLVRMEEDFFALRCVHLYPFLVTRQVFAGVGRVGGHMLTSSAYRPNFQEVMDNPIDYIWVSQVYGVHPDESVKFQLSQRADHILKPVASRVRFNRAIINPKWEHYYSHDGMHRLHILFGEANQSEYAYALKVGTTSLVLRLIEDHDELAEFALAHPVLALRQVSRDETRQWPVHLANGDVVRALDIQFAYLQAAQRFRGQSDEVNWVLDEWQSVLEALERDPTSLADRLDWVAKRRIVEEYMRAEGLNWESDALHSVDLEYHNIDPAKSLFHALQDMGQMRRFVSEVDIGLAMSESPQNTRAMGRSQMIRQVLSRKSPRAYAFDWSGASTDRHHYVEMPDPYETYDGMTGA